jgi:hypothetical protein
MPTAYDDCIAQAQAALDKLSDLETDAMKRGDLATMNALQSDANSLGLKLTQLRALAIDDDDAQIIAINKRLDAVTASATAAQGDLSKMTDVLSNILLAAKLLDSIIALIPKAA